MSELHTHEIPSDDAGIETIEPEETITSDEKPHEIEELSFADYNVRAERMGWLPSARGGSDR